MCIRDSNTTTPIYPAVVPAADALRQERAEVSASLLPDINVKDEPVFITAPLPGTAVSAGSTIQVSVTPPAGTTRVLILLGSEFVIVNSAPFEADVNVAQDLLGEVNIGVIALDAESVAGMTTVPIQVVTSATVTSLRVFPSSVLYMKAGETLQLEVVAEYSDGITRSVTQAGTAYQTDDAAMATVDADGIVKGVGTGSCTLTITYSLSLDVPVCVEEASPLGITSTDLPNALTHEGYGERLFANGGVAPYTWSITSGSLPAGLSLSASGLISGTPSSYGTANFTACVTDQQPVSATKSLSITVAEADSQSPTVSGIAAVPADVREGIDVSLTLTATANDSAAGGSNIAAAEYFIGADPGAGNAAPMSAADGAFDSAMEAVTATVDTSSWIKGTYRINVRGKDAADNWTVPVAHIDVPVVDGTPPGAVGNLSVTAGALPATIAASSWSTAGTMTQQEEEHVIDIGSVETAGAIELIVPRPPLLFPTDFSVMGSANGSDWTLLAQADLFKPVTGAHIWQFEAGEYRYIKPVSYTHLTLPTKRIV